MSTTPARAEPARPTAAAVIAAVLPFLSAPVAFAVFGLASAQGGGLLQGLTQAWAEGGAAMFFVVLASGAGAFVCAALLFFGVQRGAAAALGCSAAAAVPIFAGALGPLVSLRELLTVLAAVDPADRLVILAAAVGETTNVTAFGFACGFALAGASAAGCAWGAVAQRGAARGLLLVSTAVHGLVALSSAVVLHRQATLGAAFRAVAHAAPAERVTLLAAADADLAAYRLPLLALVVALLLVAVVGAWALRGERAHAVLVPLFAVAGLTGLGASLATRGALNDTLSGAVPPPGPALVPLDGVPPSQRAPLFTVTATQVEVGGAPADEARLRAAMESAPMGSTPIALRADVAAGPLLDALSAAASSGKWAVELHGETTPAPVHFTSELRLVGEAMNAKERAVELRMAVAPLPCEPDCTYARSTDDGLSVGSEHWVAARPTETPEDQLRVVYLLHPTTLSPQALVRGALAAASHRAVLTIVFDDGTQGETEEPAPTGGGAREEIRGVVSQHRDEIRRCYEQALRAQPNLAGRVVVGWTVLPDGRTAEVSVEEDGLGDEPVAKCLLAAVRRWRFPKPEGGAAITVRYPWVFKPAQ